LKKKKKEEIAIVNIYAPNMGAPKYIKLITNINNNIVIVGDFIIPLTSMDRSFKQKINKEIVALNDTLDQMDICRTNICRTLHSKTPEYTLFSSAHGTFSRLNHILGNKTSLSKLKKIEVVPHIFSYHNAMKLEINHKKKYRKNTNTWMLNNMLLNNEYGQQRNQRGNQKIHGEK